MSNFKDGKFKQKNPQRRAIREAKFDEFDAEVGKPLATDPLALELDGNAQLGIVKGLLGEAKGKHDGDTAGIEAVEALLGKYALTSIPAPSDAARLGAAAISIPNYIRGYFNLAKIEPGLS